MSFYKLTIKDVSLYPSKNRWMDEVKEILAIITDHENHLAIWRLRRWNANEKAISFVCETYANTFAASLIITDTQVFRLSKTFFELAM